MTHFLFLYYFGKTCEGIFTFHYYFLLLFSANMLLSYVKTSLTYLNTTIQNCLQINFPSLTLQNTTNGNTGKKFDRVEKIFLLFLVMKLVQ